MTYASPIGNTLGQHNKDLEDDTNWLCVIDIRILRTCVNLYSVFTELSHRTEVGFKLVPKLLFFCRLFMLVYLELFRQPDSLRQA